MIAWGDVPTWLALAAAVAAGYFARQAAHWTGNQAASAREQVTIARQELELARQEATDARAAADAQQAQAERAERRLAQSRLDALAPTVHAVATLGGSAPDRPNRPGLEVRPAHLQTAEWQSIGQEQRIPDDEGSWIFRVNLTLVFRNVSSVLARIDLPDPNAGEFDRPVADGVVVAPGDSRAMIWSRTYVSADLATEEQVHAPERSQFRIDFWVRDLGLNVRDVYAFSANVAMFSRDGGELVVRPNPSSPWTEAVAWPWPERDYGRAAATAPPPPRPSDPSS